MKRRTHKSGYRDSRAHEFDSTEFLLLAFVALTLLVLAAWQTGSLPPYLTQAVLGASAVR